MENSIGFGISIIVPDKCFKLVILFPTMHGSTIEFSINSNTSQTCSWKQKIILSTMLFVIKKYNYLLFVLLHVLINFLLWVLYCMVHCFLLDRSFITFTGYVVGLIFGTVQPPSLPV